MLMMFSLAKSAVAKDLLLRNNKLRLDFINSFRVLVRNVMGKGRSLILSVMFVKLKKYIFEIKDL
jgi:hypothetical protein